MRKLLGIAVCAAAIAAVGPVPDARAGVTVDLLFIEKNRVPIAPTNTVAAEPGDGLKLALVMRNDVDLSGHAFSINYDLDGDNELDVQSIVGFIPRANWKGIAIGPSPARYGPMRGAFSPTTSTFVGSWNSTNGASQTRFLPPAAGPFGGGYVIGTVGWVVKAGVNDDGLDIIVGFLNPGVDGLGGAGFNNISASAQFHGATVNLVPEPATAALLGLGLVGLVLAGRRKGSR